MSSGISPATLIASGHAVTSSKEEWKASRDAMLVKEKALMKQSDQLTTELRSQPYFKASNASSYKFTTLAGETKTLVDLFENKSQLAMYHFMLGPEMDEGCFGCSFLSDQFDGMLPHLQQRDTAFIVVSAAEPAKIAAFQKRMGWSFPWVSSYSLGSFSEEFNDLCGTKTKAGGEMFAFSTWYKEGGDVCLTYLTSNRGCEVFLPVYAVLDRVAKGRDEKRAMQWVKLRDTYESM